MIKVLVTCRLFGDAHGQDQLFRVGQGPRRRRQWQFSVDWVLVNGLELAACLKRSVESTLQAGRERPQNVRNLN